MVSFVYLEWTRAQKLAAGDLHGRDKELWERARTHGLKEQLRAELETQELQKMYAWTHSPPGIRLLQEFLREALHARGGALPAA